MCIRDSTWEAVELRTRSRLDLVESSALNIDIGASKLKNSPHNHSNIYSLLVFRHFFLSSCCCINTINVLSIPDYVQFRPNNWQTPQVAVMPALIRLAGDPC